MEERNAIVGVILRVGVFAFLALLGFVIFPQVMRMLIGPVLLVISALGTFAAAAVANAFSLRIFERGQLADIGLGWTAASRRNLLLGTAGGVGAGLAAIALPILLQAGSFQHDTSGHVEWSSLLFLSVVLLFGAIGEEMLFRGYGFQVLVRFLGPFATVLPVGILFAFAHAQNLNFSWLAFVNTALWGILLGAAFLRSGDLWLPIGLHFGWNWALPLLGVNLSGFTMSITGYTVHWNIGVLWSGGSYGPEGGLFTTAVVIALFFFLWKAPIQQQNAFLLEEPAPS